MHTTSKGYIAWLLLFFALSAWALVVFFALSISGSEAAHASVRTQNMEESARASSAVRTHALVAETEDERAQLEKILDVEALSMADILEDVGKSAGVKLRLSGASPQPSGANSPAVPLGFHVDAEGKFSALARTLMLLEKLPLASEIDRIELDKSTGSSDSWHMSVSLHVLTTSKISI